ncbi:MAG TPA: ferredoxin-thioredoxin reductase catalytic domain-containing protein [Candidatus Sabulitectum sp.]|nr:ferredoxin-thioredoxin reductase catalytic domain-containing protein [Candidatus Sabulitectum sp.]HPF32652.1 ferredoxin-thioredoxin reductase catalytic domain-containing protein [Candidatus Sabulitectum sp.]HPJ28382.1 ferredoxin-thioredoxin reductase catalytic domain-containing protein [Candidatus Sabulitectum sp.]HPR22153.1 ferredoxin-thioredoxin reductase catalytic domain-containing protein [Candidatus Sabulitectum sp.]
MGNTWDPVVNTETYLEVLRRAEEFASLNGYRLNDDRERIEKVIGLMTMNVKSAGDHYCPCKQSHPLDPERDVVCPCPELSSEIEADGNCFCKLFFF